MQGLASPAHLRQGLSSPVYWYVVPTGLSQLSTVNYQLTTDNCLWDWVVAAAAPGVAGEDTFEGEPAAFEEAVLLDGLDAVVGAGRNVATALPEPRRQRHLIDPNQQDQELSGQL